MWIKRGFMKLEKNGLFLVQKQCHTLSLGCVWYCRLYLFGKIVVLFQKKKPKKRSLFLSSNNFFTVAIVIIRMFFFEPNDLCWSLLFYSVGPDSGHFDRYSIHTQPIYLCGKMEISVMFFAFASFTLFPSFPFGISN